MKFENLTPKEKPKFKPIQFSITLETEAELREMWHRLNVNHGRFQSTDLVEVPHSISVYELWEYLNSICIDLGIRK